MNFDDYRDLSQVFEDAAAWWYPQLTLTETGHDPLRVNAVETTPQLLLACIGVQPVLGAGFPATAVLLARCASRSSAIVCGASGSTAIPSIVGKTIALNGPPFTGRRRDAAGFQLSERHRRVAAHARGTSRSTAAARISWSRSFRLKPGVTVEQANAELRALTTRLGAEYPGDQRRLGRARDPARAPRSKASSGRRCSRCSARRRSCC